MTGERTHDLPHSKQAHKPLHHRFGSYKDKFYIQEAKKLVYIFVAFSN